MTRAQAFGRYELLRRISIGGMAEVFHAIHTPSGTSVALKRILPEIAEDEEFIHMFEDEARIASQLEHPHIARCLDFGRVDNAWFISFEFVEGKDLRTLFDRSNRMSMQPPLWFVVHVLSRIGEGLAYAHARKDPKTGEPVSIVHRDVSPQNIIVSFDGDVKLIDFGIAKAAGKLSRTQVGTIKGKFGYMSPEQVTGLEVDQRADVFALGICLWELLTMKRLFAAENEVLVLEKIRRLDVPAPSTHNREVAAELDRIVLKALAKNPDERYRSAREFYRDLNNIAQSMNLVATRSQIAQYMRRVFPEVGERLNGNAGSMSSASSSLSPSRGGGGGGGEAGSTMNSGSADSVRATGKDAGRVQETGNMAADNKGSDLDIFEGLGKKTATRPPPAQNRPAPSGPPGRPQDPAKKTLLGLQAPSSSSMPVAPPATRSAPPPPPGRGSLPQVVPPPRTTSTPPPPPVSARAGHIPASGAPGAPAPATSSAPPPPPPAAAKGQGGLDMDWDDEDEATHIFDKGSEDTNPSMKAAGPSRPTPPPPNAGPLKNTLMMGQGPLAAPPPPPPPPGGPMTARPTPPPPPPSLGTAFARASGMPAAQGPIPGPPPPTINPMPPGHIPGGPMQTTTAPMPMPGLPPATRPPSVPPPRHDTRPSQQPAQPSRMEATALVRPPPPSSSKAWIWVVAALVLVLGGVGAAFFLLMPKTGRIVVNVNDAKGPVARAEVFVDGKKQCDTTPCIVDQVNARQGHTVSVLAQGSDKPLVKDVSVETGKDTPVAFEIAATKSGTGIKVTGSQPGVKLFVDGKEIGPLPQELKELTAGDHNVKIQGTERYASFEKKVVVAKDEIFDLGPITLKVIKGKATISLATPGAKVYLVNGSDRRELPTLPMAVDLDAAKEWVIEASKTGLDDFKQKISFDDGQAEKTFNVELGLKGAPSASASVSATATVPLIPTIPTAHTATTHAPTVTTAPTATQPPVAAGEAWLNINSIPPSSVFLDNRAIGATPKMKFPVNPGAHTIRFVNSELSLTKTISVVVGPGETKFAVTKLQ